MKKYSLFFLFLTILFSACNTNIDRKYNRLMSEYDEVLNVAILSYGITHSIDSHATAAEKMVIIRNNRYTISKRAELPLRIKKLKINRKILRDSELSSLSPDQLDHVAMLDGFLRKN